MPRRIRLRCADEPRFAVGERVKVTRVRLGSGAYAGRMPTVGTILRPGARRPNWWEVKLKNGRKYVLSPYWLKALDIIDKLADLDGVEHEHEARREVDS